MEKFFKFSQYQTTAKQEIIAGITTFLTMAYIVFVNPVMLSATLGYDAIVGVAMILLGVGIGFSTGILAPTTAERLSK